MSFFEKKEGTFQYAYCYFRVLFKTTTFRQKFFVVLYPKIFIFLKLFLLNQSVFSLNYFNLIKRIRNIFNDSRDVFCTPKSIDQNFKRNFPFLLVLFTKLSHC